MMKETKQKKEKDEVATFLELEQVAQMTIELLMSPQVPDSAKEHLHLALKLLLKSAN